MKIWDISVANIKFRLKMAVTVKVCIRHFSHQVSLHVFQQFQFNCKSERSEQTKEREKYFQLLYLYLPCFAYAAWWPRKHFGSLLLLSVSPTTLSRILSFYREKKKLHYKNVDISRPSIGWFIEQVYCLIASNASNSSNFNFHPINGYI